MMTQKRQIVLQLTLLAVAMATLVILPAAVPACTTAAPTGQASGQVEPDATAEATATAATTTPNTPTPESAPDTTPETQVTPTNTHTAVAPTATQQSGSVSTDPCRAVVADVGRPIAPYVFGAGQAGASGAGGVTGAAGKPDPTITVVDSWETVSMYNHHLHPPTIDNMTPFHDFVVHGIAVDRTDLLYSADGRKFVYGFVNFRVREYLKGTGPEYICVTDSPEIDPYHRLYTGKEYIIMLQDPNDYYGGGLHSDTYDFIGAMGWQVDGKVARLMPEIPEPWRSVITSDRRRVDELWLTPEPHRTGLGKATDLATLKGLIRSASTSSQ